MSTGYYRRQRRLRQCASSFAKSHPAVGRWLSVDPIGFEGNDANLYRYVRSASINSNDFNGFEGKSQWGHDIVIMVPDKFQAFPPITSQNPSRTPVYFTNPKIQRQKAIVREMRQALVDCLDKHCATDKMRRTMLSHFDKLIYIAQTTFLYAVLDNCTKWVNSFNEQRPPIYNPPDIKYITVQNLFFDYSYPSIWEAPLRHCVVKITICEETVFYLDNGWWDYIFTEIPSKRVGEANEW